MTTTPSISEGMEILASILRGDGIPLTADVPVRGPEPEPELELEAGG